MTARSTGGLLFGLLLALVGILIWNPTRSLGVDPSLPLRGTEIPGNTDPTSSGGGTALEPSGPAREAALPAEEDRLEEVPRPRLLVQVTSEGTRAPARPLPGAEIHAEGFDVLLGRTDATGRLEVELPDRTEGVQLHAEAPGHARGSATAYVRDGVARAELTLQQVAVLIGRVRHADGRPAVEVRVAAITEEEARGLEPPTRPRRRGPGTPSTSTDEQGLYELEVIAGAWRLASSSLAGYERPWGWTEVVEAIEGAETRVEDLVLPEASHEQLLQVRVVDVKHEPVAHARVGYELVGADLRSARGFVSSDGDGRFVLVGRPGDTYEVVASANAAGFATVRSQGVVGGPALELVLGPAPILEVVVRTPDGGEPEQDLRWRLGRMGADEDEWLEYGTCLPAEGGRFATTWPEGADLLEILAAVGYEGERVTLPQLLKPPTGGEPTRVEVLLREGLRVEGRVLEAARGLALPIVRARLMTDGDFPEDPGSWPRRGTLATRAAQDGSFRLGLPGPGVYAIGVTGDRREPLVVGPYEILAPPGVLGLELALKPANAAADDR